MQLRIPKIVALDVDGIRFQMLFYVEGDDGIIEQNQRRPAPLFQIRQLEVATAAANSIENAAREISDNHVVRSDDSNLFCEPITI